MKSIIKELWRGNVMPPEDGRHNTPEMQQLLEYISRHNDDLLKTMTETDTAYRGRLLSAKAPRGRNEDALQQCTTFRQVMKG